MVSLAGLDFLEGSLTYAGVVRESRKKLGVVSLGSNRATAGEIPATQLCSRCPETQPGLDLHQDCFTFFILS